MNLEFKYNTNKYMINDTEVEIKDRIPTAAKIAIITSALQQAYIGGAYNQYAFECSLYVLMVHFYTDIKIDNEENENMYNIFDKLETNGIISKVVSSITATNKDEINNLMAYADKSFKDAQAALNSAGYAIEQLYSKASALINTAAPALQKLAEKTTEATTTDSK